MQEICQSGSEGGGAGDRSPYPYFIEYAAPHNFSFCFSAARVQISRRNAQCWPAPLKNKKKISSGLCEL